MQFLHVKATDGSEHYVNPAAIGYVSLVGPDSSGPLLMVSLLVSIGGEAGDRYSEYLTLSLSDALNRDFFDWLTES